MSEVTKLRLERLSDEENEKRVEKRITEKTVEEVISETHTTIFDIINDILNLRSIDDFAEIFLKGDRLIYMGIYFCGISLLYKLFKQNTDKIVTVTEVFKKGKNKMAKTMSKKKVVE